MWRMLAITLVWLGTADAAAPIAVDVKDIRLDPGTGSPVVQLIEKGGRGRSLPIWIGPLEAQAIAIELEGVAPPRPLSHDLMKSLVEALGARLDRVGAGQLGHVTDHSRHGLHPSG